MVMARLDEDDACVTDRHRKRSSPNFEHSLADESRADSGKSRVEVENWFSRLTYLSVPCLGNRHARFGRHFWRNKLVQIQSPVCPCSHSRGLHWAHLRITFRIITPHFTCLIPACMPQQLPIQRAFLVELGNHSKTSSTEQPAN